MSENKLREAGEPDADRSSGPNLILIYSLLGAAFALAITIAVLIVLPFYRHH